MWAKLEAAFGSPPDLNLLLAASDEALRAAGMSRQKSGYIRSLAELVISGELDLDNLPDDDEEAIALLTKIKGIGRWSAEIYLLFAEGRADVFPAGDLAVMVELGRLMGLDELCAQNHPLKRRDRIYALALADRPGEESADVLILIGTGIEYARFDQHRTRRGIAGIEQVEFELEDDLRLFDDAAERLHRY